MNRTASRVSVGFAWESREAGSASRSSLPAGSGADVVVRDLGDLALPTQEPCSRQADPPSALRCFEEIGARLEGQSPALFLDYYGTLTEIGYALQSGIPVIGLNTWAISRNSKLNNSIIPAESPAEAVKKALELAID